ncbi:hypothetical protein SAMN06265337_0495 [Hymenobacter gelipurpurascens]|uniref:Uncharacterized protein n=1 Tax=Hymenobacter gelipurpurascens TaxID=89968 RepID=A0A212T6S2_9BACT|nr:hypothetical protein SAMN06265337_0495 [Hymenobacter gelipurpurascens]
MKILTPILMLLLVASGVECRTAPIASGVSVQGDCKHEWVYREYSAPVRGKVVFYEPTADLCGLFPTASVTLVKTGPLDTIRVLDLCYMGDPIPIGVTVTIQPVKAPGGEVDVPADPYTCSIKTTCFGTVKSTP